MYKIARFVIGLVVFVASYAILTFLVAPLLTQKGGSTPLDEAEVARFPVVVAIRRASEAARPSFAVVQMRELQSVTAKAADYSFLLPVGSNKFVDQDGDPAGYTADDISPGRQRIALRATVGDYTHDVQYEAEQKKVFPMRTRYTGPQIGIITIPISLLLSWIVLRLTRRRKATEPHSSTEVITATDRSALEMEAQKQKRTSWFAYVLLGLLLIAMAYMAFEMSQ